MGNDQSLSREFAEDKAIGFCPTNQNKFCGEYLCENCFKSESKRQVLNFTNELEASNSVFLEGFLRAKRLLQYFRMTSPPSFLVSKSVLSV
jgi:hypothetical protein